ncbi:hypothetical protein Gohar_002858 [Gossypium harknessii]|uniref:Uncharacterized protein n=1 Tax=Gossypium harknessii TaxID=34285 RepID=A0A7J9HM70_9ROSI|nr:hypothetical protein [Gossypium harknessii]
MAPNKRSRTSASSSNPSSELESSFSTCFQSRSTSELNLHDRVLHLILTWN